MEHINWLAVLAAAASAFLLGGIWYGPLFKRAWSREAGVDPTAPPKRHPAQVFGFAFLLSLIAAIAFALFLGPQADMHRGVQAGIAVGLLFVVTSFGINYLFAGRSLKLWMIDGGYHFLQFALYGLIIGAWR